MACTSGTRLASMAEEISVWTKGPSRVLIALGAGELIASLALAALAAGIPVGRMGFGIGGGIMALAGVILLLLGVNARRRLTEIDRLRAIGISGTAKITGLQQTAVYMKGQPYARITLEVSLPGKSPYTATIKTVVPMLLTGKLTGGDPVPVKVDPSDPQKLIIDFAEMLRPITS